MQHSLAARPTSGTDGIRLFCFHHAGGGAATFAGWQRRTGDGVQVLPVRLPGRETRHREPPVTDGARLIDAVEADLAPLLDEPYALYGHSLGALVAYRLAEQRVRTGQRPPELLTVGACAAPQLSSQLLRALLTPGLPDEELIVALGGRDSIPAVLRDRADRLARTLATLRADLFLAESLRRPPVTALPGPLDAYAGADDPLVGADEVRAWRRCTSTRFRFRTVSGTHFFVRDREVPRAVGEALRSAAPRHVGRSS
ncbi:alpha/beta fold hydrolase [Streptomyces sp. NPDC046716]|uniref:thioesterase II family protein n=1 Tax=Streptomyces sp. NPDC046716 TaxID=3157093 RepID=UPI0033FAA564